MRATVMQQLDPETRREYDQALALAPHLLQEETPFVFFLQTDNFNQAKAAQRLALYWKYRKDLFQDRWLLPLNQTGTGALSMTDIDILRTGYIVYHPSRGAPGSGASAVAAESPIFLCDLSRVPHQDTRAELRIIFYLLHAHRDDAGLRLPGKGVVVLHIVTSAPRPLVNLDKQPIQVVEEALPLRIKLVIVVQAWEEGRERLIESLAYQQVLVCNYRHGKPPVPVAGNSVAETLQNLENHGIPVNCVPTQMGGGYHYSAFE